MLKANATLQTHVIAVRLSYRDSVWTRYPSRQGKITPRTAELQNQPIKVLDRNNLLPDVTTVGLHTTGALD